MSGSGESRSIQGDILPTTTLDHTPEFKIISLYTQNQINQGTAEKGYQNESMVPLYQ